MSSTLLHHLPGLDSELGWKTGDSRGHRECEVARPGLEPGTPRFQTVVRSTRTRAESPANRQVLERNAAGPCVRKSREDVGLIRTRPGSRVLIDPCSTRTTKASPRLWRSHCGRSARGCNSLPTLAARPKSERHCSVIAGSLSAGRVEPLFHSIGLLSGTHIAPAGNLHWGGLPRSSLTGPRGVPVGRRPGDRGMIPRVPRRTVNSASGDPGDRREAFADDPRGGSCRRGAARVRGACALPYPRSA
jgi:hypothetical protein